MSNEILSSIETYALIRNADKSILKVNSLVEPMGYSFVVYELDEFEKSFSKLLLPNGHKVEGVFKLTNGKNITVSFYRALFTNLMFGKEVIDRNYIILLKNLDTETIFDNNSNIVSKTRTFVNGLLFKFRLLRGGGIECPLIFQFDNEDNDISRQSIKTFVRFDKEFSINDFDLDRFESLLNDDFDKNILTKLAISNFNLSYDISDKQVRFITLMTAFESLFNQSSDQITHTVSRHLAILIATNKEEFFSIYKKIKELYKVRSKIVHGQDTAKVDITRYLEELEEMVRIAIIQCNKFKLSKDAFFNELNAMGFGK